MASVLSILGTFSKRELNYIKIVGFFENYKHSSFIFMRNLHGHKHRAGNFSYLMLP